MPKRYPEAPPRFESPRWRVEEVELAREPDLQVLDVWGEWRVLETAGDRIVLRVPWQRGDGFFSIPTFGPTAVYVSGPDEAVVVWPTGRWERRALPPPEGEEVVGPEDYRRRRRGSRRRT